MAAVRPLLASLNAGAKHAYKQPDMRVDHLVVGGGVVGLAIANALARRWPEKTTFVVERHQLGGQETSSRNSEVIHAGMYYPRDSLKTRFCLRGRELLYQRAHEAEQGSSPPISVRQVGKLVVGDSPASVEYLEKLHRHCASLGEYAPPTQLLSGHEAREMEPDLSDNISRALFSSRTGIISAHELMANLEAELDELPDGTSPDAQVVHGTSVVRIDPHTPEVASGKRGRDSSQEGWVVQTRTHDAAYGDTDAILARVVINASGLNAPRMLNSLVEQISGDRDKASWIPMYFSKGSYASYRGPGIANVKHLIYPTPNFGGEGGGGGGAYAHQSLGTHLTLDLEGNVRFGPDVKWLTPPPENAEREDDMGFVHDFWESQLYPEATPEWYAQMHQEICKYLPQTVAEGLAPDYSGLRPKLAGPDAKRFVDFGITWHASRDLRSQKVWQEELPPGAAPGVLVSLLGVESPGLTSSLAIGEHVVEELARRVWGTHNRRGRARQVVHDAGHESLEEWV